MTNNLDEFEKGLLRLARSLDVQIDKLDKTGNSLWLTVSTVSPTKRKIYTTKKKVAKKKATRASETKSKVKFETPPPLKKKSIAQQRDDMKAKDSSHYNTFGRHPRGSYWRG